MCHENRAIRHWRYTFRVNVIYWLTFIPNVELSIFFTFHIFVWHMQSNNTNTEHFPEMSHSFSSYSDSWIRCAHFHSLQLQFFAPLITHTRNTLSWAEKTKNFHHRFCRSGIEVIEIISLASLLLIISHDRSIILLLLLLYIQLIYMKLQQPFREKTTVDKEPNLSALRSTPWELVSTFTIFSPLATHFLPSSNGITFISLLKTIFFSGSTWAECRSSSA